MLIAAALPAQQTTSAKPPDSVPVVMTDTQPPVVGAAGGSSVKIVTPTDSALVRAARKTGTPKKKKSRVHIDDASVKKSKGKLVEISSTNQHALPPVTGSEVAKLKADQMQRQKEAAEASERLQRARTSVSDLEKELTRLEEEYYGSDDPSSRDQIIEPRFNKTKEQLARARAELAAARDAAEHGGAGTPDASSHP